MKTKGFELVVGADGNRALAIQVRGADVLDNPRINRGTAFTLQEREALGLHGLLPHAAETLDQQAARSYEQFKACANDIARWVFLSTLHDSNEVLFYRLVGDHVAEMLPIVYTPTVGQAIQEFSRLYRRPRGVFLSIDDVNGIDRALEATGVGPTTWTS